MSPADRLQAVADQALRSDERVLVGCIRVRDDGVVEREERASAPIEEELALTAATFDTLAAGRASVPARVQIGSDRAAAQVAEVVAELDEVALGPAPGADPIFPAVPLCCNLVL